MELPTLRYGENSASTLSSVAHSAARRGKAGVRIPRRERQHVHFVARARAQTLGKESILLFNERMQALCNSDDIGFGARTRKSGAAGRCLRDAWARVDQAEGHNGSFVTSWCFGRVGDLAGVRIDLR